MDFMATIELVNRGDEMKEWSLFAKASEMNQSNSRWSCWLSKLFCSELKMWFFSKIIQKQKWNPIPNQRLGDFKNTEVPNQVSSWMGVVPTSGVVPKRSFGPNDQPINGRGNRAPGENWPKKTLLKFDPGWNKMIAF